MCVEVARDGGITLLVLDHEGDSMRGRIIEEMVREERKRLKCLAEPWGASPAGTTPRDDPPHIYALPALFPGEGAEVIRKFYPTAFKLYWARRENDATAAAKRKIAINALVQSPTISDNSLAERLASESGMHEYFESVYEDARKERAAGIDAMLQR